MHRFKAQFTVWTLLHGYFLLWLYFLYFDTELFRAFPTNVGLYFNGSCVSAKL